MPRVDLTDESIEHKIEKAVEKQTSALVSTLKSVIATLAQCVTAMVSTQTQSQKGPAAPEHQELKGDDMSDATNDQEKPSSKEPQASGGMGHERTEISPPPFQLILTVLRELTNTLQDFGKTKSND